MDFRNNTLTSKALDFAELSLAGQKRKSGEYFIDHCKRVAEILVRFQVTDPTTLSVAFLHHSFSEGAATMEDIEKEFGGEIAGMVETLEKLRIIRLGASMQEEFVENLRKMFLVLARDLRVVLIKLADISDNLTTLNYLSGEKQQQVARETVEIFAPLAERLGMGELRGEMQDLAFPYLDPEGYDWVKKYSQKRLETVGKTLLQVKSKLVMEFKKDSIQAQVQSRVKHLYSLYKKLLRPEIDKDINKIYDLIALRVIVATEEECYKVLDIIQKNFKLVSDVSVRDHIAHPKPNGYRSIHLSVVGAKSTPFEIQIRTLKMHEESEYGVAAHWHYSDKKSRGLSDAKASQGFAASADKLEWVRKLSDWQQEITDNQEFLKTIKTNLFGERIYVFTPKGDVKDLPAGATPIDFAYKVHTDLGPKATGAKVNGRMVSLDYKLKNADTVEIVVSKDQSKKPNRDWLGFVATSTAKKKIKKAYY